MDPNDESQKDALLQSEEEKASEKKVDPSDTLTPDHPRFKEVIAEKNELKQTVEQLQSQLEELKQTVSQRQTETGSDTLSDDEQRALDRIANGLKTKGIFVSAEDIAVQKRAENLKDLSQRYSGSDGAPKFDATDVVSYAKANGFGENYEAAYKSMHYQAFVQMEARKLANGNRIPGTEKAEGEDREAPETQLTNEQIAAMSPAEYERRRPEILAAIRDAAIRNPGNSSNY